MWRDAVARGRVSPFEMVLTMVERQELERRAGTCTALYAQVVHAKLVLLAAEGWRTWRSRLDWPPVPRWCTGGAGGSSSNA